MDDTVWVESAAHRRAELRANDLARAALTRANTPFRELPPRLVVVDVDRQRVYLLDRDRLVADYPISTAASGIGSADGSLRTPPGWHRIHARIGAGEPLGAVFESRKPTGAVWLGEARDEDLILTRVLTLQGLEPGVNQGAGVDSLARYIYLHGTNHESELGRPTSHGCVRLSNEDIVALFDHVAAGDPVVIVGNGAAPARAAALVVAEAPRMPDPLGPGRFHYAGLGGSGMSALAQFQVMRGGRASGSDRAFDRGERAEARAQLERLGIEVRPQDGSGLSGDCAALVVSTAVEAEVPDVAAARALGIPIVHRSDLLAHFVDEMRTIAIAGTSGKSTAVAMTFEILRGAELRPSVITGGDVVRLQNEGLWGNAWYGGGEALVVEADESDGSLIKYRPAVGVVMNLQRDHKEMSEVAEMFATFRSRTRERFVVGEADNLASLAAGALVFGFDASAEVRGTDVVVEPDGCRFVVDGVRFRTPVPGVHNVENALAAIASCRALGVPLEAMVAPLEQFQGVGRRFQVLGSVRGIEVVDDFAHNPAKLAAAIATARNRARRVLAVYQPHGFGPTRFLRPDLVETFATALGAVDRMWMLEVFYAGGTAQRDFSAADIVSEISARGANAEFAPSREWLVDRIAKIAQPGDLVLIMGARDPSLTTLGRQFLGALSPS
jgi:UDP-N-acetylmuramate--alanine ligase